MPPSIGGIARWLPSRCPRCEAETMISARAFSSSPAVYALGPENPKYIEVPQPKQARPSPKPEMKGTLPVPRNIFPRRSEHKVTPEYLEATTPEPRSPRSTDNQDTAGRPPGGDPRQADYLAWKRRLAASRRNNLRTSLTELHERSEKTAHFVAARSERRRQEREELVHRPPREDERLTSPSTTPALRQLQVGAAVDPERAARVAAKTARYRAQQAARRDQRRDATHTLYMHARDFITTEAKLDDVIDNLFVVRSKAWDSNQLPGENIWNLGPPENVQQLLARMGRQERFKGATWSGMDNVATLTDQRIRKIAEELTGGKM